jgi:hypothetical protein
MHRIHMKNVRIIVHFSSVSAQTLACKMRRRASPGHGGRAGVSCSDQQPTGTRTEWVVSFHDWVNYHDGVTQSLWDHREQITAFTCSHSSTVVQLSMIDIEYIDIKYVSLLKPINNILRQYFPRTGNGLQCLPCKLLLRRLNASTRGAHIVVRLKLPYVATK